jgi:cytochrome c
MRKIFAVVALAVLSCIPSVIAAAQETATPKEVVDKVKQAAQTLSKAHDVAQFNQRQGPWVWKDTYVFVLDCDKQAVAAYPISAEYIGKQLSSIKDAKGHQIYSDVPGLCRAANTPTGVWLQYYWPKPGENTDSRKVTYFKAAKGTPYIVGAGIYDDKQTAVDLQGLMNKHKL